MKESGWGTEPDCCVSSGNCWFQCPLWAFLPRLTGTAHTPGRFFPGLWQMLFTFLGRLSLVLWRQSIVRLDHRCRACQYDIIHRSVQMLVRPLLSTHSCPAVLPVPEFHYRVHPWSDFNLVKYYMVLHLSFFHDVQM